MFERILPAQCFSEVARVKEEVKLCETIGLSNFELGEHYKELCFMHIAETKLDINICEKIDGDERRSTCYGEIAKKRLDENFCQNISLSYPAAGDDCYISIAESQLNTSYCEKIHNDYAKKSCYKSVEYAEREARRNGLHEQIIDGFEERPRAQLDTGCGSDTTGYNTNLCFQEAAIKNKDETICKEINGMLFPYIQYECFRKIAEDEKNISICDFIVDNPEYSYEKCYSEVATEEEECEEISRKYKDRCYHRVVKERFNYPLILWSK